MISFRSKLLKFGAQGEKTGWTYLLIPAEIAQQLKPNNKKSFRVKGQLDNYTISKVALLPMGDGNFIMAVNAAMRKGLKKQKGDTVQIQLQADDEPLQHSAEFIECLSDEPAALKFFYSLPLGHQNYFSKWIDSAKTDQTKAKRIAQAVSALQKKWGFNEMARAAKAQKDDLV